ncbi:MAG: ArnT family glycosyltransferase [Planctomycetota bacterium]
MLRRKGYIFVLVAVQTVLGLACLNCVPRIYIDEAWDSALGYNLARTGALKHPFIEGFGGIEIHFVQNRIVLPLVCAGIFAITDYSIVASRIGSVIFSIIAIVSLYSLMRHWFGDKQAFFIGLATVINPWFFEISRRARPEIYYTALGLLFLWLLVRFFDSGSRVTAVFAGVVAGLSALTHPNGLILVFSIGCAAIVWLRGRATGRLIGWGSAGFVIIVLPYIVYVLWAIQEPQVSFAKQMQVGALHSLFLKGEVVRWKGYLQWPKGLPLTIVMLFSWIAAWYASTKADKTVATIIVLYAFILPFASVNCTARYLAPITPLFGALIARLVWRIMAREIPILLNRRKLRLATTLSVMAIYLSTCTAAVALLLCCLRRADFSRVIDRVASVVGRESRVYGDPIFWVGHDQYRYGPYLFIYEYIPLAEAIERVRKHDFDYAIRTAWQLAPPSGFADPPGSMPAFREDCLGDHVCGRFGSKVDEFYDPYYGPIEIYRLDWGRPLPYHRQFK